MRQHDFLVELMVMATAQEELARRRERAETEELALALTRSLEGVVDGGAAGALLPLTRHGAGSATASDGGGAGGGAARVQPPRNMTPLIDELLPAMAFSEALGFMLAAEDGSQHECAVCLTDFAPAERVRVMPCVHVFHKECVDRWLTKVQACPTCKQPVALG